jgi:hypothetical protein
MNWNLRVGRRQGTRAKFLRHSPNDRDVRIAGRNVGFAAARGGAQRRTRWTGGLCRRAHAALHLEHRGPDAVERISDQIACSRHAENRVDQKRLHMGVDPAGLCVREDLKRFRREGSGESEALDRGLVQFRAQE